MKLNRILESILLKESGIRSLSPFCVHPKLGAVPGQAAVCRAAWLAEPAAWLAERAVAGGYPGRSGPGLAGAAGSWPTALPAVFAHAATWARDENPSLARMFATCRATVATLMTSSSAMALLRLPATISATICRSRWVSPEAARPPGHPQRRAVLPP
jgi:hypothetical protein